MRTGPVEFGHHVTIQNRRVREGVRELACPGGRPAVLQTRAPTLPRHR